MSTVLHAWPNGRFIEIQSNLSRKQLDRMNQGSNFLAGFLVIEIMQECQSNLKEKDNPSILKEDFSSGTDPSIITSIVPVLFDWSNKTR